MLKEEILEGRKGRDVRGKVPSKEIGSEAENYEGI